MKQFIFKFSLCFWMFWIASGVYAQEAGETEGVESDDNLEVIGGMTWYLKKEEAFKVAREQNKYVFLLWGRDLCERCEELRLDVAKCPIQPVIAKHYILWYSDSDVYDRTHSDVSDYLSSFSEDRIPLPVICIINPADEKKVYGLQNGDYDVYELAEMLDNTVGNDRVSSSREIILFVFGDNLVVKGGVDNEIISVYTIAGVLIDQFRKITNDVSRNIAVYPDGMLVVTGSSGWSKKLIVK